ncbi:MAG TPA: sensor histidine kinase [Acidimicrobiia bacterium]|nr:sensor histidine kinase [Acidimicrobiia bacterium]
MSPERLSRALDRVLDPLIAGALFLVGLLDIWVFTPSDFFTIDGSRSLNTLFLLLVCLPLVWRRRAPLAALVVVLVVSYTWAFSFGDLTIQPPFEAFLALLFTVYTVGAQATGLRVWIAVAILILGFLAEIPLVALGKPAGNAFPAWIFFGLTFVAARVVHRQRILGRELAERASELEQEREEKARLEVALERTRIARELHDVVTHNVSLMVLQASVERRLANALGDSTIKTLASIEKTGRQTLSELRRVLGILSSNEERQPLAPQPTIATFAELVDGARTAGLPVELVVEGEPKQLSAGVELCAYRIVQEALTNTLKHAEAANARVRVHYENGHVDVEVTDDGRGAGGNGEDPAEVPGSGHGLVGMRERVELYEGVLEVGSMRDAVGYRVFARLPTSEEVN